MEPISILLLAAVLTKMVTTYKEDREYARAGMEPPRHKLYHRLLDMAEKRQGGGSAKGSGRRSGAPARPGARGYFKDLWHDSWDDLGDYRRRLRDEHKTNPRMTQAEQLRAIYAWGKRSLNRRKDGAPVDDIPVDDMVDVAGVRPVSVPPALDPWAYAEPVDDAPTSVVHDGTSVDYRNAGKFAWHCRRASCPGKGGDYATNDEARAAAAAHRCKDTGTLPAEGVQILGGVQPAPISKPTPTGEQPKLATVIPMFPNLKEILMSETNTEVIGLEQSIGYSKALAHFAGTHGPAGNEGYIGVLNRAKVSGTGLSTAHEMQEAFANAQAVAERHAAELEKQKTVQEAYDQNPDAGDKEYMQQGR